MCYRLSQIILLEKPLLQQLLPAPKQLILLRLVNVQFRRLSFLRSSGSSSACRFRRLVIAFREALPLYRNLTAQEYARWKSDCHALKALLDLPALTNLGLNSLTGDFIP